MPEREHGARGNVTFKEDMVPWEDVMFQDSVILQHEVHSAGCPGCSGRGIRTDATVGRLLGPVASRQGCGVPTNPINFEIYDTSKLSFGRTLLVCVETTVAANVIIPHCAPSPNPRIE